jgi:hypothetical protein
MENWKDVKGYEKYQISNLGRVKSLDKIVKCRNGFRSVKERIMKLNISGNYTSIQLGNKSKTELVHRLVALAFIENNENKPCVNHINGIKTDNRVENLEWVTYSENNIHAINVLKIDLKKINKENFKRCEEQHLSKLKINEVKAIRLEYKKGLGIALGKKYNVSQTTILNIIHNKIWVNI